MFTLSTLRADHTFTEVPPYYFDTTHECHQPQFQIKKTVQLGGRLVAARPGYGTRPDPPCRNPSDISTQECPRLALGKSEVSVEISSRPPKFLDEKNILKTTNLFVAFQNQCSHLGLTSL